MNHMHWLDALAARLTVARQPRFFEDCWGSNTLLEKLKANIQEVRARGGELIVFADPASGIESSDGLTVVSMPEHTSDFQAPIVYTLPHLNSS